MNAVLEAAPEQQYQMVGKRYQIIDQIGSGGMGRVYAALDRLSGQQVALKRVTLPGSDSLANSFGISKTSLRFALAGEFKTLASLRHPYIISVLDYGFDERQQPYYTMDLLENAQPLEAASIQQPIEIKLDYLVQTLQAVAYLHRRGVLHRDLKPDNVLVVDGQVKVLDFGLAIARDQVKAEADEVVGTLTYIAPEMLSGAPASKASDLYAVGVIAYELLTGKYPYRKDNAGVLMTDILKVVPDFTDVDLDPRIIAILQRLLAKNPSERLDDAGQVVQLYIEATGRQLKYDTSAVRESFLQSAQFIGRERELETLTAAIDHARSGAGSAWLIAGESGIGKSRLLEEVRTQALVDGALTLRGQAQADASLPYQLWRDAVRYLCLQTPLTDLEASVLKLLVPDIAALIGRDVYDAPDLEAQAAQTRLLNIIEDLFRQQTEPMVLLLEDLHWSSESLTVLKRLARIVKGLPLVIVGTYRDDERPDLPAELPDMRVIKLSRLDTSSISELSASMLGENGRQQSLINLLERETEGNIFFIVEVVRALAEEAGDLELVGQRTLPENVFAGGMRRILQRRLAQVPAAGMALLRMAAINGRQLDLKLLKRLAPGQDLDEWLTQCANAAVLDVYEDRWRFSHDKLREAVIRELPEQERRALHQAVAEGIEAVYAADLSPYYAALALHWRAAGVNDKTLDYLARAGQQALDTFAYKDALKLYDEALTLAEQGANVSREQRALWRRRRGQAFWGMGDLDAMRREIESALADMGMPVPNGSAAVTGALLRAAGKQFRNHLLPPAKEISDPERVRELARSHIVLAFAYFFLNEPFLTTYAALQQVNLGERLPPTRELAEGLGTMTLVAGLIPLPAVAGRYFKRAYALAHQVGEPYGIAQVCGTTSLYWFGQGDWTRVKQLVTEAQQMCVQIGDMRQWESVTGVDALMKSFHADFSRAIDVFRDVYESSSRTSNLQTNIWGMLGQGENLFFTGDTDSALEWLKLAQTQPIHRFGRDSEIRAWALATLIHTRLRNQAEALTAADKTAALIAQGAPTASYLSRHYASIAALHLTLWEDNPSRDDQREAAKKAIKLVQAFARIFPIGAPVVGLYQSWYDYLSGKTASALRQWQRGIESARQLGLPYEEAQLLALHGRVIGGDKGKEQLGQALAIFERVGAAYDAERVRRSLA